MVVGRARSARSLLTNPPFWSLVRRRAASTGSPGSGTTRRACSAPTSSVVSNAYPPTVCFLLGGIWSIGAVMLLLPSLGTAGSEHRASVEGRRSCLNSVIMTLFLWHMTAFLLRGPACCGRSGSATRHDSTARVVARAAAVDRASRARSWSGWSRSSGGSSDRGARRPADLGGRPSRTAGATFVSHRGDAERVRARSAARPPSARGRRRGARGDGDRRRGARLAVPAAPDPAAGSRAGRSRRLADATRARPLPGNPVLAVGALASALAVARLPAACCARRSAGGSVLAAVAALVLGAHALLLGLPLLFSRDVYSYAFYGRIAGVYGGEPVRRTPLDHPSDPLWRLRRPEVGRHARRSTGRRGRRCRRGSRRSSATGGPGRGLPVHRGRREPATCAVIVWTVRRLWPERDGVRARGVRREPGRAVPLGRERPQRPARRARDRDGVRARGVSRGNAAQISGCGRREHANAVAIATQQAGRCPLATRVKITDHAERDDRSGVHRRFRRSPHTWQARSRTIHGTPQPGSQCDKDGPSQTTTTMPAPYTAGWESTDVHVRIAA